VGKDSEGNEEGRGGRACTTSSWREREACGGGSLGKRGNAAKMLKKRDGKGPLFTPPRMGVGGQ